MAMLSRHQKGFLKLLQTKRIGDSVTEEEILEASKWKRSTFRTHLLKNAFAPFIEKDPKGSFRVLMDGSEISEDALCVAATQVRPTQPALHPGDRLKGESDTYILSEKLGNGAVGHVWKAQAERKGGFVAVKVMMPREDLLEPSRISNVAIRFYREAKNGLKIDHPCIVRHLDRGLWQSRPFLVMELAKRSLSDRLRDDGSLSLEESKKVVASCVSALEYLHGNGSIHRDVKPANLLETSRGYVLADLGIVKWNDLNPEFTGAATITRASIQLGSWYYMAPEQLSNPHEAVEASDIYALGVSWLELLTKSTSNPAEIAAQRFQVPCEDAAIEGIIRQMVSYDHHERPKLESIQTAMGEDAPFVHVEEAVSSTPTKPATKSGPGGRESARQWLRVNGYVEVADEIDAIMAEWKAAGKKTRRDWWKVLAGRKNGTPITIEGREFPVLKAMRMRAELPDCDTAIENSPGESAPPKVATGRWQGKK